MSHPPVFPHPDVSTDRRAIIDRSVILHATSPDREVRARLLGRIVEASGAHGAAYGWTDDLAPRWIVPVYAVSVAPVRRWEPDAPRSFSVQVEKRDGLSWHLVLREVDDEGLERASRLIARATESFRGVGMRDRPRVPEQATAGAHGRFLALLDAYRLVGFETGSAPHERFLEGELQRSLKSLDGPLAESARAVTEAFGNLRRLAVALLELGNVLEDEGLLPSAAATYVIAYELALLRGDSATGIDAARFAGRAYRKLTAWERAVWWYGLGSRLAELEHDPVQLARVLDGLGNTYRDRGAFPKARECYQRAWDAAQEAGDPVEIGNVAHDRMNAERKAGRMDTAAELGWKAIRLQTEPSERAPLLIDVGTLFMQGGDLDAAELAYGVARRCAASADVRFIAEDAFAHCSALRGDALRYRSLRPRAPKLPPPLRVQIGYYRGAALLALGDPNADRVLAAVERYARAHGLAEWEIRASQLAAARPLPPSARAISAPDEVRQGLRELSASAS